MAPVVRTCAQCDGPLNPRAKRYCSQRCNWNSTANKLCATAAILIRQLSIRGAHQVPLADAFGVRQSTVWSVIHGQIWSGAVGDLAVLR